jgi:hypothetical protein
VRKQVFAEIDRWTAYAYQGKAYNP